MLVTAILLDATGIQDYIFGSTQLKENIGASFLVENVYEDILKKSLEEIQFKNVDLNAWKKNPESILKPEIGFDIGYIGGGNALLFFKEQSKAKNFVRSWTKRLLIESPGLKTAAVITDFELNDFSNELIKLFKKLKENKFRFQPQIVLPSHGITGECNRTGLSAEVFRKHDTKLIPVSSVVASKTDVTDKANENLGKRFQGILNNKYHFPEKIDELGQQKGENNFISIVHIDGNGIGDRFKACKTLKEIRELSIKVENATEKSMEKILKVTVDNYAKFRDNFKLEEYKLPVRPIIFGGDDVTFITDGRLGVYFARIFIEEFIKYDAGDGKPLSVCAGIAITKSKYPFYRGYELSEQLCREAKKKAKEEDNKSSWLDFHIASGGFSGTITEIREKNYTVPEGNLCLRPYRVAGIKTDYRDLKECINGINHLNKWPRSKLMELREILNEGQIASEQFIKEIEFRGLKLPEVKDNSKFKNSGWSDKITPYFDMIDLKDFYPDFEIDEVKY
ncbi:MAG: hypothetical protein WA144_06610 [Candidatus Methanoperedens sp.]